TLDVNDDSHLEFALSGFGKEDRPGYLALPMQTHLIALPDDAKPNIELVELTESRLASNQAFPVVPKPDGVLRDDGGNPIGGAYAEADPVWLPTDYRVPYRFEEIGIMGGTRLARLTVFPLRIDQSGRRYAVETLSLQINYNAPSLQLESGAPTANFQTFDLENETTLSNLLAERVINRVNFSEPAQKGEANLSLQAEPPLFEALLTFTKSGLTDVTYEDLLAADRENLLSTIDPAQLHLYHGETAIAYAWLGDDDALFEAGEGLRFYVAPWASRWTDVESYRLAAYSDLEPAARIVELVDPPLFDSAAESSLLTTVSFEENKIYSTNCFCGKIPEGHDGDRWMWAELRRPGSESAEFEFELPELDASGTATLTLSLIGFSKLANNPGHLIEAQINGIKVGEVAWDQRTQIEGGIAVPPGALQDGINTLVLTLIDTPEGTIGLDAVWIDRYQVTYRRSPLPLASQLEVRSSITESVNLAMSPVEGADLLVYDVTQPEAPVALFQSGRTGVERTWPASPDAVYLTATDQSINVPAVREMLPLQVDPGEGGDYLILSHADFIDALAPLVERREDDGYSVVIEPIEGIYDHFGGGEPSPHAIKAYIANAYAQWAVKPEIVLLVGDGTYDPKLNAGGTRQTWIPPFLDNVDPWMGETASDNQYVAVDGDDRLPDIMLGRLPVNSVAELQTVIEKIEQYETVTFGEEWQANALFVADNRDSAGNFAAFNKKIIAQMLDHNWRKILYNFDGSAGSVETIYQNILDDWNSGVGLIVFSGHSSIHQWAVERLFHIDDVAGLENKDRLPIMIQLSCLSGAYHQGGADVLNEALLLHPNGGVAAVWGPTGLGVQNGHDSLAVGSFDTLDMGKDLRLGETVMAGYTQVYDSQPGQIYLVDAYLLLGDP
ncbi:MAG: C25 family cysteine peptidase, partial [Chloroflexota bacterium]